jgi:L-alanine-DL-glutamate epimerase-like enolase superfamily enzyme
MRALARITACRYRMLRARKIVHASMQWAAEPIGRAGAIIEVPQRPGLGLEVNRAVLERYAVTTGEKTR